MIIDFEMSKLRVGLLGLVHDHLFLMNEINNFFKTEIVEVTCAADLNEFLLSRVKNLGVQKIYKDYREMLDKEKLDAVAIYAENNRHAELTEAAAEKGLHVLVEKPMAPSLKMARKMVDAAEKNKVRLMINFPTLWRPTLRHASELAIAGKIGRIFEFRHRSAHRGPKEMGCTPYFYDWLYDKEKNGAGAFMDFCCYGAMHSRWILGLPEKVTSIGGNYVKDYISPLEDNAILLMGYERAVGISEASWSQMHGPGDPLYPMIIRGIKGTLIANFRNIVKMYVEAGEWEDIQVPSFSEGNLSAPDHFINSIIQNKPFIEPASPSNNLETQAILEAGLLSLREERTVKLKEILT